MINEDGLLNLNNSDFDIVGETKSIAEKESEVVSLILFNGDGKRNTSIPVDHIATNENNEILCTVNNTFVKELEKTIDHHVEKGVDLNGIKLTNNDNVSKHYSKEMLKLLQYQTQDNYIENNIEVESTAHKSDETQKEVTQNERNGDQFVSKVEEHGNSISLNIHSADAAWITLLDKFEYIAKEDRIRGYVEGEKSFLKLWETFQTSTMSSFTVRSSEKFYRNSSPGDENVVHGRIIKGKPQWKRRPLVPFDGTPFVQIERKYSGCRLGGAERSNKKKGLHNTTRHGHSVKVGCPAEAEVLEIWRVPELALKKKDSPSSRPKSEEKKRLLSKVHEYIALKKFRRRYYVMFPLITKHHNHSVLDQEAGKLKLLHPKIIELIYDYVNQGILEKKVIRCMLEEFVRDYEKDLNVKIRPFDRSFYPTDRDIGNHIRNALSFMKNAKEKSEEKLFINIEGEIHEIECETALNVQNEFQSDGNRLGEFEKENLNGQVSSGQVSINNVTEVNGFHNTDNIVGNVNGFHDNVIGTINGCHHADNVIGNYREIVTTSYDYDLTSEAENIDFERNSSENLHLSITGNSQFLNTSNVQSVCIEDIIQNNVLDYYQNNDPAPPLLDKQIRFLVDPCNKKKNRKRKTTSRDECAYKDNDLKVLLKEEIRKSLLAINEHLLNESDESKLKVILRDVKSMQTFMQGQQAAVKRERKTVSTATTTWSLMDTAHQASTTNTSTVSNATEPDAIDKAGALIDQEANLMVENINKHEKDVDSPEALMAVDEKGRDIDSLADYMDKLVEQRGVIVSKETSGEKHSYKNKTLNNGNNNGTTAMDVQINRVDKLGDLVEKIGNSMGRSIKVKRTITGRPLESSKKSRNKILQNYEDILNRIWVRRYHSSTNAKSLFKRCILRNRRNIGNGAADKYSYDSKLNCSFLPAKRSSFVNSNKEGGGLGIFANGEERQVIVPVQQEKLNKLLIFYYMKKKHPRFVNLIEKELESNTGKTEDRLAEKTFNSINTKNLDQFIEDHEDKIKNLMAELMNKKSSDAKMNPLNNIVSVTGFSTANELDLNDGSGINSEPSNDKVKDGVNCKPFDKNCHVKELIVNSPTETKPTTLPTTTTLSPYSSTPFSKTPSIKITTLSDKNLESFTKDPYAEIGEDSPKTSNKLYDEDSDKNLRDTDETMSHENVTKLNNDKDAVTADNYTTTVGKDTSTVIDTSTADQDSSIKDKQISTKNEDTPAVVNHTSTDSKDTTSSVNKGSTYEEDLIDEEIKEKLKTLSKTIGDFVNISRNEPKDPLGHSFEPLAGNFKQSSSKKTDSYKKKLREKKLTNETASLNHRFTLLESKARNKNVHLPQKTKENKDAHLKVISKHYKHKGRLLKKLRTYHPKPAAEITYVPPPDQVELILSEDDDASAKQSEKKQINIPHTQTGDIAMGSQIEHSSKYVESDENSQRNILYESNPPESNPHESNAQESNPHESNAQESNAQESNPHESNAQESNAQESYPHESNPHESNAQEISAHEDIPVLLPDDTPFIGSSRQNKSFSDIIPSEEYDFNEDGDLDLKWRAKITKRDQVKKGIKNTGTNIPLLVKMKNFHINNNLTKQILPFVITGNKKNVPVNPLNSTTSSMPSTKMEEHNRYPSKTSNYFANRQTFEQTIYPDIDVITINGNVHPAIPHIEYQLSSGDTEERGNETDSRISKITPDAAAIDKDHYGNETKPVVNVDKNKNVLAHIDLSNRGVKRFHKHKSDIPGVRNPIRNNRIRVKENAKKSRKNEVIQSKLSFVKNSQGKRLFKRRLHDSYSDDEDSDVDTNVGDDDDENIDENYEGDGEDVARLSYLTEKFGRDLANDITNGSHDVDEVGRSIETKVRHGVHRVVEVSRHVQAPHYDRYAHLYPNNRDDIDNDQ